MRYMDIIMLLGATIFPHNIGLGAANDPELMRQIGKGYGFGSCGLLGSTGYLLPHWPLCAMIAGGRTYEGYSEDPEIVKALCR